VPRQYLDMILKCKQLVEERIIKLARVASTKVYAAHIFNQESITSQDGFIFNEKTNVFNVTVFVGSYMHPLWMHVQNLLTAYIKTSLTRAYPNNGRLDDLNGDSKKGSFAVALAAFAAGATIAAVLSNPNTRNRISEQGKKLLKRIE